MIGKYIYVVSQLLFRYFLLEDSCLFTNDLQENHIINYIITVFTATGRITEQECADRFL